MTKVLLDTNIWIRYILRDNEEQFKRVKSLIEDGEEGKIKIYCSSIIFLEVSYVLKNVYNFKFEEILQVMTSIRLIRGLTVLQDTDIDKALNYFKIFKIKFSDCLIASQLQKNIRFITFDLEFKKVKEIASQTPQEFLSTFTPHS